MKSPQLQWKPLKRFPGEYECKVGHLVFSVSCCGHWDISSKEKQNYLVTIAEGRCDRITQAKRKCQQWLTKQWNAMMKLPFLDTK